jgi:hypothetical protein
MDRNIAVIVAILCVSSVSASTYMHDAESLYVFEDFENFNVSQWSNYTTGPQTNVWRVVGGQLVHQVDYVNTTGLIDSMTLADTNFIINPRDEWDIKVNITTQSASPQQRLWVAIISNYTLAPFDYNLAQEYWYVMMSSSDTVELHSMQGIDLHERYNVLSGSGHLSPVKTEFEYRKRNIVENNTWYVEVYEDGSLLFNDSSVFHNNPAFCSTSPFCPRTTDNFTFSEFYFTFGGFSATQYSAWYMDEFSLSVDKYLPCTPDWVCAGYGECNETSADCDTAVDLNACGLPYAGDYSEFEPQSCGVTGYVPAYTDSDISSAAVDGVVKLILGIAALASLIGIGYVVTSIRRIK